MAKSNPWRERIKARSKSALDNVSIGDQVHVEWFFNGGLGCGAKMSSEGEVIELDDWIKLRTISDAILHFPISGLRSVRPRA